MKSPRQRRQDRPSSWSRARRELASPQGLTLTIALVLCFFLTIIALILESYLHVPQSVVLIGVITAYVVVIGVAMYKILTRNKRDAEARRQAYYEKFEKRSGL
jgi:ABC-type transport system involved in cytochrome bd biosynthesis fused ATPase/permease subunit